jgi:hypothetical protein
VHNTIMEKPLDISLRILALLIIGVLEIMIAPFKATGKICLIVFEEILQPIHGSISNVVKRLEDKAAEQPA